MPSLFICESCTVRCVLQRELYDLGDLHLLGLERMRILDVAHSWAPGSFTAYQPYLRVVERFQARWNLTILERPQLARPPHDQIIPLMWCQESHGLRPGRHRNQDGEPAGQVAFATVRQIRSAVAHYEAWRGATTHPGHGYYDHSRRLIHQSCRPTDTACLALFSKGLAARTGAESKPSKSLLYRHVAHLDARLDRTYREQEQLGGPETLSVALAGLLNLLLWLGWLRSSEGLGLDQGDLTLTPPDEGGALDLPPSVGALQLKLRPETKSSRGAQADMILAYRTASGFHLGLWYLRVQYERNNQAVEHARLFSHPDGTPWDSAYFRNAYLYPSLHAQRAAGDAYLTPFGGPHGMRIEDAFYSLGSYRSGARSWVSKNREYQQYAWPYRLIRQRKATNAEIYEHARWRKRRQNEDIDKIYQQWTYSDRIAITTECM